MLWRIRLQNQPPITVNVQQERDLHSEFLAASKTAWWKRVLRICRYWAVDEDVTLQCDAVVAIENLGEPRAARRTKKPIGFR